MTSRRILYLISLIMLQSVASCGFLLARGLNVCNCNKPFSGVSADFSEFSYEGGKNFWLMLGGVVDSPFSLIADIVALPYDVLKDKRDDCCPPGECPDYCERQLNRVPLSNPIDHPSRP